MREPQPGTCKCVRVIARLNVGGPARHVILLNHALGQRGYRTLLVHGSVDSGEASLEHLARDLSVPTVKIVDLGRRINVLGDARALWQLIALLFRESPDVIHTHTAKAGVLGRLAGFVFNLTRPRARRAVIIHTFHGHVLEGYFNPATNTLIRFAERTLARVTDRVVTISPSQREDIVKRFGVAPDSKTVVIPLGLDLEPLLHLTSTDASYRRELSIAADDIVVGYVGRMVPIKDLDTLVSAFVRARSGCGKLHLMLAGDGPVRRQVEAAAQRAGVADRVHFIGWTENLAHVYATIDLLALSSLNEGTPAAILEAMAAGKPVVSTAVGAVRDIVENEVTGLLVPPRDAEALGAAIVRVAGSPEERRRYGAEGRKRVGSVYSAERLVADIEHLYGSALQIKRRTVQ